jgi:hypothetical protein
VLSMPASIKGLLYQKRNGVVFNQNRERR